LGGAEQENTEPNDTPEVFGIHDAIARKLNEKGKLSQNAIAEGIINNVGKTIIRNQLTDPRSYAEMSKLVDDLIKQSRADATDYEAFLKNAEGLVKHIAQKNIGGHPAVLNGYPGAIALFNNLTDIPATIFQCPVDEDEKAKLALDLAMRQNLARSMCSTRSFPSRLGTRRRRRQFFNFRDH
jgi:type I restriction enzyme R subunit